MAYIKPAKSPPLRSAALAYGENGPGIYPDETVVKLDTGELAAVSVERAWLPNGAGIGFRAYARWINADGSSKTSPGGELVESVMHYTADMAMLQKYAADDVARDMALLALGEEPLLKLENGSPVIHLEDADKLSVSVRSHIKAATDVQSTATGI